MKRITRQSIPRSHRHERSVRYPTAMITTAAIAGAVVVTREFVSTEKPSSAIAPTTIAIGMNGLA